MIEPKIFYRELDEVLSTIGTEKVGETFFVGILNELENKFGDALCIQDSHVYEQRGDSFEFVDTSTRRQDSQIAKNIPISAEAIQRVLKEGIVAFDAPGLFDDFDMQLDHEKVTPAAILVHNIVRKWLLVFELKKGFEREEVSLFLNAMRTALNYRLFSEMMKSDMAQAEQIQKSLLPRYFPRVPEYDIYARSQPAEIVGGDFYDFFQFSEDDFGGCLGDASGHGLPAALLVRDVVIGLRMGLAKEMRLVHTIEKLNQVIQRSTYSTNFVSIFVGEVESDGHLFYVNAGHPPPFLVKDQEIIELEATGITLGFLPDIELRRSYVYLEPGSVLVLYSDGIVERERGEDDQFELRRLQKLVLNNQEKSAKEITSLVFDTVYDFGKRTSWDDDATLMVIKRRMPDDK